jgi:plasmid stabilization system protein ParE
MKHVRLLAVAERELRDAVVFYERQVRHLGRRSAAAVRAARREIAESPQRRPTIGPGVRRLLVQDFPYALIYRIETEDIVVIAVMHLSRRPGCWAARL